MASPKLYELNGKVQTARQWAEEYGLPRGVVATRLSNGASIQEALAPVNTHGGARQRKPRVSEDKKNQKIEDAIAALRELVIVKEPDARTEVLEQLEPKQSRT